MAMNNDAITFQTGARRFEGTNFTKYSGFIGGNNSTYHSLLQFSPQVNGFGRLFMVRQPYVVARYFAGSSSNMYADDSEFTMFKHALEYYLAGFNGLGDIQIENTGQAIQGGYAGRSINIPSVTKETTEQFTTRLYEFNGSLIANVVKTWMNMISDINSGLSTYGGLISAGMGSNGTHVRLFAPSNTERDGTPYNEANHTAEFIYILTDRSGVQVESAWLLADCYPKTISQSVVSDMTPGTHDVVTYEIPWNCNVYQSPIITKIADDLLKEYIVVSNALNFNPQLGDAVYTTNTSNLTNASMSRAMGLPPTDSISGHQIGNTPVFYSNNARDPRKTDKYDIDTGMAYAFAGDRSERNDLRIAPKLAGQGDDGTNNNPRYRTANSNDFIGIDEYGTYQLVPEKEE